MGCFSLSQPTCSSFLLPSMIVNLKTGRKGKGAICYEWTTATKVRPIDWDPRVLIFQDVYNSALQLVFIPAPRESLLPYRESSCLWHPCFWPVWLLLALEPSCCLCQIIPQSPITTADWLQVELSLHKQIFISFVLNPYEIVTMWKGKREGRKKKSFWLHFAEKMLEEVNTQDEAQEVATQKWSGMSSKNFAHVCGSSWLYFQYLTSSLGIW